MQQQSELIMTKYKYKKGKVVNSEIIMFTLKALKKFTLKFHQGL